MALLPNWEYIAWRCSLVSMEWNKKFIQTYKNMGCKSLNHQWTWYKKETWRHITSGLFYGICSYYRSYFILETISTIYYSQSPSCLVWWIYNSHLYIEWNHTPGYLLLRKYPKGHFHDSDLLNLIPCKIDPTSTTFSDETIITYDIELPPSGKKIGFKLLDDENFTIPYITDTIS